MSETRDKNEVIKRKKSAIRKLNNLLESYITSDDDELIKKADLLSYWMLHYSDYIQNEKTYNPKKQIKYKRGDIIKLDFGFNVGDEYGGLHYAIVVDKQNDHSCSVVTVIPLTSGTEDETYRTDVFLGNELYQKIYDKWTKLNLEVSDNIIEVQKMQSSLEIAIDNITELVIHLDEDADNSTKDKILSDMESLNLQLNDLKIKNAQYEQDYKKLTLLKKELDKMKSGSIALMKQITTVSKQRIYTPRKSSDALYHISLSEIQMEKINQSLKDLYIF